MSDNPEKHPSYAMLQLSKVQGGEAALFGSSIRHSHTVRLAIAEGVARRDLSKDWYTDGKKYIEIEMSYSQFAQAIMSFGVGSGVPVTLKWLNGQKIEECPFDDKRQKFEREFEDQIQGATDELTETINEVRELFQSKKNITNKDKDFIMAALNKLNMAYGDKLPFMYKQFNEQMDKTVTEAKGEVESFVQAQMHSLAIEALREKGGLPELPAEGEPPLVSIG